MSFDFLQTTTPIVGSDVIQRQQWRTTFKKKQRLRMTEQQHKEEAQRWRTIPTKMQDRRRTEEQKEMMIMMKMKPRGAIPICVSVEHHHHQQNQNHQDTMKMVGVVVMATDMVIKINSIHHDHPFL